MAKPVCSSSMSPGSTTTLSASMISCSVFRSMPRHSWPRWWAMSTSTPRPCTPWYAMCSRPRCLPKLAWPQPSSAASGSRADDVLVGPVAVVVHRFLDAVAVDVELGADVGERVPLRRVLQRQRDVVVGPHVDVARVHVAHVDVEERLGVAVEVLGRREARRATTLVQGGPAREVERQAEAEADARLHLGDALQHLLRRDQVDAAEFVVVTPVAPRRSVRALTPSLRHGSRRIPSRRFIPIGPKIVHVPARARRQRRTQPESCQVVVS